MAIEQDEPEDERQDEADWNEDREGYTLALVDTLVGAGQATDHEEDADVDQEDPHGDQDEEVARLYLLVQAQAQQAEEASMVRREEDEIRDQSAIDLPADPRVGRQLVEHVLLDQLALQMRLLLAPIGPIFGYLAAHLVDVHEDGRGDRDWCHLQVGHLTLEHVDLEEETQVDERQPNHVQQCKTVDEAAERVERAMLCVAPTNWLLEELLRDRDCRLR